MVLSNAPTLLPSDGCRVAASSMATMTMQRIRRTLIWLRCVTRSSRAAPSADGQMARHMLNVTALNGTAVVLIVQTHSRTNKG